jgi:hypothetical protein
MTSTCGRFLVLGVNPFTGVRYTGFTDGDCLWDLSLGQLTGDGKFDGKTFWVGCGWFFFFGGSGRGRGTPGHVLMRRFGRTTRVPNIPFYVIYYILISGGSGGFTTSCVRLSRRCSPIHESLVRHVFSSSFDNLTTSSTH